MSRSTASVSVPAGRYRKLLQDRLPVGLWLTRIPARSQEIYERKLRKLFTAALCDLESPEHGDLGAELSCGKGNGSVTAVVGGHPLGRVSVLTFFANTDSKKMQH